LNSRLRGTSNNALSIRPQGLCSTYQRYLILDRYVGLAPGSCCCPLVPVCCCRLPTCDLGGMLFLKIPRQCVAAGSQPATSEGCFFLKFPRLGGWVAGLLGSCLGGEKITARHLLEAHYNTIKLLLPIKIMLDADNSTARARTHYQTEAAIRRPTPYPLCHRGHTN
jgi:hypothetical protein